MLCICVCLLSACGGIRLSTPDFLKRTPRPIAEKTQPAQEPSRKASSAQQTQPALEIAPPEAPSLSAVPSKIAKRNSPPSSNSATPEKSIFGENLRGDDYTLLPPVRIEEETEEQITAPQIQVAALSDIFAPRMLKVGVLLPLTGRHAELAQLIMQAMHMAIFDQHRAPVELVFEDTRADPAAAAAAALRLKSAGVRLIMGPLLSSSTQAAIAAVGTDLPIVSFSNDPALTRSGAFAMGLNPGLQVARIIGYARSQGYKRFALIAPQSPYGRLVEQALFRTMAIGADRTAAIGANASVVARAFFDPGTGDFTAAVKRLAPPARADKTGAQDKKVRREPPTLPYDAVLIAAQGKQLSTLTALMSYYDINPQHVRYLGASLWESEAIQEEPSLQGGWFPALSPERRLWFSQRYHAIYNRKPPPLVRLGYDAAALACALASRFNGQKPTSHALRSFLLQPQGFSGVGGAFRFLANGYSEHSLAILKVDKKSTQVIDAAAQSFTLSAVLPRRFSPQKPPVSRLLAQPAAATSQAKDGAQNAPNRRKSLLPDY